MVSALALSVVPLFVSERAEGDEHQSQSGLPSLTSQRSVLWIASMPLVALRAHGGDQCYSMKDLPIVRYEGRWHLFCKIRSELRTYKIEYRSFEDWNKADDAQPNRLKLTDGYY